MTDQVVGVDGARGGWMAARLTINIGAIVMEFHATIESLVAELSDPVNPVKVLAIDMPIGLSATGHRTADGLARQRLGPRRSTFFPTPIRSVLDFDQYADANAHSKELCGLGLSKQAWNLVPKISEIDDLWTQELSDQLVEAHPETSFAEMAGAPVMTKKATMEGRDERVRLLSKTLSTRVVDLVEASPKRFAIDTVDALALAWTAQRSYEGTAVQLGGELDQAGRPMRLTI